MNILCVSGWGQPYDALSIIAPDAVHVDYAGETTAQEALQKIAAAGRGEHTAIGWSLGGQLLVRAIAAGLLRPKRLLLIAAPFQFVYRPELPIGMRRDLYDKFRDNYARDPQRTLHKSWELIVKGDTRADEVRRHLEDDKRKVISKDWLRWLDILEDYSCAGLDFSHFPETLLVHGDQDAIVFAEQAPYFAKAVPCAQLQLWKGCGHAPHWHDPDALRAWLTEREHV